MTDDDPDRKFLTTEEAAAMLPDGDDIHVFLNSNSGVMIGADWRRHQVIELFNEHKPEIAGPMARASGHGIAVMRGTDRLFIATR
jgi:hypothetical protein